MFVFEQQIRFASVQESKQQSVEQEVRVIPQIKKATALRFVNVHFLFSPFFTGNKSQFIIHSDYCIVPADEPGLTKYSESNTLGMKLEENMFSFPLSRLYCNNSNKEEPI